jgi:nucleoside-diphosphate-sugar epimerase
VAAISIAITGASGFIGRHLSNALKKNKDIDLIPLSRVNHKSIISVSDYKNSPRADILIHLAQCNKRFSVNDQEIKSSIQLIHALLNKKYKTFLYISSGIVYGDSDHYPHKPDEKIKVMDNYTKLKVMSEHEILNYDGGVVARLSSVYGKGMSEFNVMSSIIKQLKASDPILIKNSNSIRDFLWIEDVVSGIIKLALKKYNTNECSEIYNFSSGQGTSILNLIGLILGTVNQESRPIITQEATIKKIECLILDNKKSIDELDWAPKTNLKEGIRMLLDNYK